MYFRKYHMFIKYLILLMKIMENCHELGFYHNEKTNGL